MVVFRIIYRTVIIFISLNLITGYYVLKSQDLEKIIDLKGKWRFSISEKSDWEKNSFDDSNWDLVNVPSRWENEGYYGYNGYGFYRKTFNSPSSVNSLTLELHLGYIDDADVVYLNGEIIGASGSFPPNYSTAYKSFRRYVIPENLLKPRNNVLAIKVYDFELTGGIVGGDIGIFKEKNALVVIEDLRGKWKFKTGDNLAFKKTDYDDSKWDEIWVPSFWENLGYRNYDGFAWYRKKVFIPQEYKDKTIVLALGQIDDNDQTFLNGKLVGQIGDFDGNNVKQWSNYDYRQVRAYYLSPNQFKAGQYNLIAVRVYDIKKGGGMYEGVIALAELKKFVLYWRNKNE